MHPEGELVCDPGADAVVGRAGVDAGVGAAHGAQVQLGAGGSRGRQVAARVRRLLREGDINRRQVSHQHPCTTNGIW